ncbi:TolC family protein [Cyclobacterium marinum]|uniref:Outer membrane efflux protein n=1 Tax=Cyclobacterium marinum (strain ATCC 25205 / DSM 745 / LMG 13164 / NCIMB 1802) TaxID=880070 RepID=G0J0W6_CYCMS|nr:TolC family protein [Cyclobacterium marinum]AEL25092.1 outer membrane efflux protein [Cyclobacterium marinum DSM 745]MBI0401437.1 TolC family protein [Cyclobacterium marinum]
MKKIILLGMMVAFSCTLYGQEGEPLTFEKAVEIGLENNFDVKIATNQVLLAENEKKQAGSLLMPVLDLNNTRIYRKEDTEQAFVSDPENPRIIPNAQTRNNNYSLVAIYGFRADAVVALQRLGKLKEVSELEAKVVIENTVAAIATAYYRLVLELQRYEVLSHTLKLSDERLEIAKAQYELGRASKRDFLAAQVDYNADLTALVAQEQVIQNSRVNLNELLAIGPDKDFLVNDTITIEDSFSLEELKESAFDQNKGFLATQRMENVAYLQLKELRAQRLPTITLNGSYIDNTLNSDAGFLLSNQQQGINLGATISLNLFSGLALNKRIQAAKIQINNQKHLIEQYENQMLSDLQRTFNTYQNSKRLLEIEKLNYEVAVESSDITLDRFRLGITNYLEFRDAQVSRLQAESRLIESLYTIKENEIELMRLSGNIYFANLGENSQ